MKLSNALYECSGYVGVLKPNSSKRLHVAISLGSATVILRNITLPLLEYPYISVTKTNKDLEYRVSNETKNNERQAPTCAMPSVVYYNLRQGVQAFFGDGFCF